MVREVHIDNRSNFNTGTVIGGAVGAAIGDRSSKSRNRDTRNVARVVGTTAGALTGGAIHRNATGRKGVEIYVRTTDQRGRSEVISIVQDADMPIHEGQRVFLSGRGRDVRVVGIQHDPLVGR